MSDLVINISSDESDTGDHLDDKPAKPISGVPVLDNNNKDVATASTNTKRAKNKGLKRKSGDGSGKATGKASGVAEKKAKKQKMLEAKAAKKAIAEINRMYKPGECMKYLQIEGHPGLWSRPYMSEVESELAAAGLLARNDPGLFEPSLLLFSRVKPQKLLVGQGEVKRRVGEVRCDHALFVCNVEELSELVRERELTCKLALARELVGARVTLLLYCPDGYFQTPNRRTTTNSNRRRISASDLHMALTKLLVKAHCDTVWAQTPTELALEIVRFSRAIAEAPYKKAKRDCDEQAQFYMRGDNKHSIAVDQDGRNVGQVWQQMVAVMKQTSLENARAARAKHPTPMDLYHKLQRDNATGIASIMVQRPGTPGTRAHFMGPALARQLRTLFTADVGSTHIN